jgi:hypothetical protein
MFDGESKLLLKGTLENLVILSDAAVFGVAAYLLMALILSAVGKFRTIMNVHCNKCNVLISCNEFFML